MGLSELCTSIRNADVIIFWDIEAVVGAVVSGKSDIPIASTWLHRICEIEEKQDLCSLFERVPSESNPADDPSSVSAQVVCFQVVTVEGGPSHGRRARSPKH